MTGKPRVSVIVVSFNTRDLTEKAVESALAQEGVEVDVWVVDNHSSDGSVESISTRWPEAHILALEENVGFGAGNNLAMEHAQGDHFLLLNSDARLQGKGDLLRLVQALEADGGVGIVGPRLENPQGVLEFSARRFPTLREELLRRFQLFRVLPPSLRDRCFLLEFFSHQQRREVDWVSAACLLVRGEVYERVGGFNPEIFMYGEEREWQHRVKRAGFRIAFDPIITVVHERGASSRGQEEWRIRAAMTADLQFAQGGRGGCYAFLFWITRLVGLAWEGVLLGASGSLLRHSGLIRRGASSRRELKLWSRIRGREHG